MQADPTEAYRLYVKASALGHGAASDCLGYVYSEGSCGVEIDVNEARRYFELSAAQGQISAIGNLAAMLANRGEYDEAKTKYFELAACGEDAAIRNLQLMGMRQGNVNKAEIKAAARLCQRAKDPT
jgi:TPR repeat protein